jgi:hypothetical protein
VQRSRHSSLLLRGPYCRSRNRDRVAPSPTRLPLPSSSYRSARLGLQPSSQQGPPTSPRSDFAGSSRHRHVTSLPRSVLQGGRPTQLLIAFGSVDPNERASRVALQRAIDQTSDKFPQVPVGVTGGMASTRLARLLYLVPPDCCRSFQPCAISGHSGLGPLPLRKRATRRYANSDGTLKYRTADHFPGPLTERTRNPPAIARSFWKCSS